MYCPWCDRLRVGVCEFNECAWSGVCACVVLEISSMNVLGGRGKCALC